MNSDTLVCLWIFVIPVGILEISTSINIAFDFISVPYTITDLQAHGSL
jgi:hypothetical protein